MNFSTCSHTLKQQFRSKTILHIGPKGGIFGIRGEILHIWGDMLYDYIAGIFACIDFRPTFALVE